MKIVILGATGRTGQLLIQQALQAGFAVVALARDPGKLGLAADGLTVMQGDVLNAADVARAIQPDADAVISVLGPARTSPDDMLPRAVEHILAAMQQAGVRRLVYMTGAGVSMPEDRPGLFDHVIRFLLRTTAGKVLEQSEQAVRRVMASATDWTVVRAPMLTDAPGTGRYRAGHVGVNTGPRLSRADAAAFILDTLDNPATVGKAPVVSN